MAPSTETRRTVGHRVRRGTVERPFETTRRRLAALDGGLLASVALTALFAAYVVAAVPATLTLLFGGFALAVAAVAILPLAVVRAVSAALVRSE